jgi:DegV family protein with EDD domain
MITIVGDTTSGLSESFAAEHEVPIIPQIVTFGTESYFEGIDITYDSFMERLKVATELPKTAAPPPELFAEVFKQRASSGGSIICILPSAIVSGTVRSATVGLTMVRESGFPNLDVRIIDTGFIAGPVSTLLRLAIQWAEAGTDADTIETQVRAMSCCCRIYFVVDTLKYLAMGGRIGGAAALLGSVLQVKPVLTMREGQVDTLQKVRTHRRAVDRLKRLVVEQIAPGESGYPTVLHAAADNEAAELRAFFQHELGVADIPVQRVPPAVVTHGGPGILGVGFFVEP